MVGSVMGFPRPAGGLSPRHLGISENSIGFQRRPLSNIAVKTVFFKAVSVDFWKKAM
jgi:hypothetical protein